MKPQSVMVEAQKNPAAILRRLRIVLVLFIVGLVLSGMTAFPLQREMDALASVRGIAEKTPATVHDRFDRWILTVRNGLRQSYGRYPWLAYGTEITGPQKGKLTRLAEIFKRLPVRTYDLCKPHISVSWISRFSPSTLRLLSPSVLR